MKARAAAGVARRLESGWLYQGPEALRNRALQPVQHGYALTLRRQLVQRLEIEAARIAVLNPTPRGREWSYIRAACRRELQRTERAERRLATRMGAV